MPQHAETIFANQPRGAEEIRFLCDAMLARLGRRLRAAGYDTAIAKPDDHDGSLLERAIKEDRLLLTCDRKMLERRFATGRVVVLPSNGLDRTAGALMEQVPVDWLLHSFSRCLVDNTLLRPARSEELSRLPERSREIGSNHIFVCPMCDRIFWPGSHVRRMHRQLRKWQNIKG